MWKESREEVTYQERMLVDSLLLSDGAKRKVSDSVGLGSSLELEWESDGLGIYGYQSGFSKCSTEC